MLYLYCFPPFTYLCFQGLWHLFVMNQTPKWRQCHFFWVSKAWSVWRSPLYSDSSWLIMYLFIYSSRPQDVHTHTHNRNFILTKNWKIWFHLRFQHHATNYCDSKSKGLLQQAEVAQGVPGRLRPRIFLTFWDYKGGRSSAKRTGRLYPRRNPWYSLSEAESTSGHMVLSGEPRKKSPVTPPGIDPGTVQPVAQCLNNYATPGIHFTNMIPKNSLTFNQC
jgi:hypothetical protein